MKKSFVTEKGAKINVTVSHYNTYFEINGRKYQRVQCTEKGFESCGTIITVDSKTCDEICNFINSLPPSEEDINTAKDIIAMSKTQKWIPTLKEYVKWQKNYNNIVNEGGDGFVPDMITREQLDRAVETLNKIK